MMVADKGGRLSSTAVDVARAAAMAARGDTRPPVDAAARGDTRPPVGEAERRGRNEKRENSSKKSRDIFRFRWEKFRMEVSHGIHECS